MTSKFTNKENKLLKFFIEREGEGVKNIIKKVDLIDGGLLDSLDIVSLANCILANNCSEISNGCAADLNSDSNYNILDIVNLINIILDN